MENKKIKRKVKKKKKETIEWCKGIIVRKFNELKKDLPIFVMRNMYMQ